MNSAHAGKETRYRVPKPWHRGQFAQKTKQIWHMSIGARYRVNPTRYRVKLSRMPINREFHAICKMCRDINPLRFLLIKTHTNTHLEGLVKSLKAWS